MREDVCLIPESRRSPGEGNGNPHQHSCLGNPMDWEAWRATVHAVARELKTTQTHDSFTEHSWYSATWPWCVLDFSTRCSQEATCRGVLLNFPCYFSVSYTITPLGSGIRPQEIPSSSNEKPTFGTTEMTLGLQPSNCRNYSFKVEKNPLASRTVYWQWLV